MTPQVIATDTGRKLQKVAVGFGAGEFMSTQTGIAIISQRDYKKALARLNSPSFDYMQINGEYYAFGEEAQDYQPLYDQGSADRYRPEYIGALTARAMAMITNFRSKSEVHLMTSQPPLDFSFRQFLVAAVKNKWEVHSHDAHATYNVTEAIVDDEPVTIAMYCILNQDGLTYQHKRPKGRGLCLDGGGRTTDGAEIRDDGSIVEGNTKTKDDLGINRVLSDLARAIVDMYPHHFRDGGNLPIERVQSALVTGVYSGGGQTLDVREASEPLLRRFLNGYRQFLTEFGSLMGYDWIVHGGGTSALLQEEIAEVTSMHGNVMFATEDPRVRQFAGVWGLLKEYRMMEAQGWL